MKTPLVLAVPTFNSERFITATLESLNNQGEHVQWWLQDGASQDGTVEIARQHARAGDTIVTEPDAGQTDALNKAMRRMGGGIIGFLNGDDCLLPGTAEAVLTYFAEHPEIDLVCGGIEWIDERGASLGKHAGRIESLSEVLDIYNVWWKNRQWVQPEVFYRRSLWERVGGFDTTYHLAFDYDFWVRCFLAGAKVAHIARPLTQFRLHSAQKSTASEQAADEIRSIVRKNLRSSAHISWGVKRRLQAELAYDAYQNEVRSPDGTTRLPFLTALLRSPSWLLCAPVRSRLLSSLRQRLNLTARVS